MNLKEIKRRLVTKEKNGSGGCLMSSGLILSFFGALLVIIPLIRILFCTILSLSCIDDDTGEKITISWLNFAPLGLGLFLFFVDLAYSRLKNNK